MHGTVSRSRQVAYPKWPTNVVDKDGEDVDSTQMMEWREDNFLERLMPRLPGKRKTTWESHPDAKFLCALAEGRLTESDRANTAAHVNECPECAELYSRLLAFAEPPAALSDDEWVSAEKRLGNWMEAFLETERNRVRQETVGSSRAWKWLGFSKLQWASSAATLAVAATALAFFVLISGRNRSVQVAIQNPPDALHRSDTQVTQNPSPQKEAPSSTNRTLPPTPPTILPRTKPEINGSRTPPAKSANPAFVGAPLATAPELTREPNFNPTMLSPDLKQAIAEEAQAEISANRDAAQNPQFASVPSDRQVPAALAPARRTFIVSHAIGAQTEEGQECGLSSGDVITRIADVLDANQKLNVLVTSSQRNDCASGTVLAITLQDIQEMYNDFQEKLDAGMKMLAENAGKNGLPYSPPADQRMNPYGTAAPHLDARADLQQQQIEANNKEDEVKQAGGTIAPSAFHKNPRIPAAPLLLEPIGVNADGSQLRSAAWSQGSRQSEPHSQQSSRSTPPASSKPSAAPPSRPTPLPPSSVPHQAVQRPSNPTTGTRPTATPKNRQLSLPRMGATPHNRAGGVSLGGFGRSTNGTVRELHTRSGAEAIFGPSGKITSIAFAGTTIRYAPNGVRRVETLRGDGTRIVSVNRNAGFVEYPFTQHGGLVYVARTYVVNDHSYARVYTRYRYRTGYLYDYVPVYTYAPAFYGWACNSWATPVYYRGWNWNSDPWYARYRSYFAPLPFYVSPALWLTDFLLAESLKTAYEAQEESSRSTIQRQSFPAFSIFANIPILDSRWCVIDQTLDLLKLAAERQERQNYWAAYGIFPDRTFLLLKPFERAANFRNTADA